MADAHETQSAAVPPEHVWQLLSHTEHLELLFAYKPSGQVARQAASWWMGFAESCEHDVQLLAVTEHVAQVELQLEHVDVPGCSNWPIGQVDEHAPLLNMAPGRHAVQPLGVPSVH